LRVSILSLESIRSAQRGHNADRVEEERRYYQGLEERYRLLFERSTEAIVIVDDDGCYIDANPAACELLGYARDQLLQMGLADLHSATPSNAETQFKRYQQRGEDTGEFAFYRPDGSYRIAEYVACRFASGLHMAIMRDITEHKQALREIGRRNSELAALHDLSVVLSRSLRIEEALAILKSHLAEQLNIAGAVFLQEENSSRLRLAASWGLSGRLLAPISRFSSTALQRRPELWSDQADSDLDFIEMAAFLTAGLDFVQPAWQSYLSFPLLIDGKLHGIVDLFSQTLDAFHESQMTFYASLAHQIGAVLQNARLFEKVSASRAELQTLSHRLIEAQETERRHLARELHDEVGQALTAVKINLESLRRSVEAPWTDKLGDSIDIIKHTLEQVRSLSLDLRPSMLDDFGLVAALRWHLDRQAQRAGLLLHFECDPFDKRLPPEIETACFRVAQEALTNILRHARASQVDVALRQAGGEMVLTVADNGVGFDVAAARKAATRNASMGLLGMEERVRLAGGWLEITSERHIGTKIRAHFPLLPSKAGKGKRRSGRKP